VPHPTFRRFDEPPFTPAYFLALFEQDPPRPKPPPGPAPLVGWSYGTLRGVRAATRSEARAQVKRLLGLGRLPAGTTCLREGV
jgi:hypothetical protein